MATVHKSHEGSCGPCSLCMGTARKYTHVEKFSEDECALLLTVESTSIDPSACICYSCSKQIKRNATNPNFQPRWNPKMCQKTLKCSISKCISPRAYKRRGHATVHEQKLNGRRNVTGKVQ